MDKLSRQHPFSLLSSAISGRPVYVVILPDSHGVSYTDGEHIYVPQSADLANLRKTIIAQSLLIAGASLDKRRLLPLVGRPDVRSRYLLLEVERCARQFKNRMPDSFLSAVAPYSSGLGSESSMQSLEMAKRGPALPPTPEWYGELHPLKLIRNAEGHIGHSLDQNLLSELEEQLQQLQDHLKDADQDEEHVKDSFWQLLSSPLGKDGLISKLLSDLLDMSSSPDPQSGDNGNSVSTQSVSARWSKGLADLSNAIRSSSDRCLSPMDQLQEAGSHVYPEWDSKTQRYRPDWAMVEEVEASCEVPMIDPMFASVACNRRFQRLLAGLCFSLERHRNQLFGDDIVLDRLVDLNVSLYAGRTGDARIYQANLKTRRDLGVQILVDSSSSTLEFTSDKQKVCDLQMAAAWQLCHAFSILGDRVAMHSFHSWGRKLVRFQRLKSFQERCGAIVKQRIQNVSVSGYSRFGAAIRHGSDRLKRLSGTPFQLLLVISDGFPYDDQYENDYAAQDTIKALAEVRASGIACVCVSLGSDAEKSQLKNIYGDANYLSVESLDALILKLRSVLDAALMGSLNK